MIPTSRRAPFALGMVFAFAVGCGSNSDDSVVGSPAGTGGVAGSGGAGGVGATGGGAAGADAAPVDATAGSVDGAGGAVTLESVCRAAVLAQCDRLTACQGVDVTRTCAAIADRCPNYYFEPGSTRTKDGAAACLPQLVARTCTDVGWAIYPACLTNGSLADGAVCAYATQCASDTCSGLPGHCGNCQPSVASGDTCTAASNCPAGTFCHRGRSKCIAVDTIVYADVGGQCSTSADPLLACKGNLACVGGRCVDPPLAGEKCADDAFAGPRCAPDLVCRLGTCAAANACGTATCDADSYCNTASGSPICNRYATRQGQACSLGDEVLCAPPLLCRYGADGGPGICVAGPGKPNASCTVDGDCEYGLICRAGTCSPLAQADCR
jgi:hypothetical protein